ncbi:MarR family transcriptional regulator [Bacillus nakamurai]|jgi:DNA-binding MarR family transcriptional regulator|uniref:MarR family transcriptional regulator n=1 Tax=Bacillus nakamurai TaxID=1793963 RepID=A0A150F2S5_9BACI|nr:MarR family transcriptional regulator [Bacillus nakamurai]KXZ13428.1 MarR family transcriptional regulator [Bacillus nakamurai]KXZ18981.1 MarR family transcriptional regulator [Bacillus nakamurai]MCC9024173.1 MarR family transcriptional regulator [Bacillus nakamurai]MCP6683751.1 MarR family transcriptional regulator [Bacillus nakamurai]MED1227124.1 MarR family transcriptional regulator [Bacillus nakamurai]
MSTEIMQLNDLWTDIYYQLRYQHQEKITHQSIRIMQVIQKENAVGIKEIAKAIEVSQNTASEHIKRLLEKKYVCKTRSIEDERKVILKLTDLGKEVLHRHSSLDEDKLKHLLFEKMSDEERQFILEALTLMKERAKDVHNR